MGHSTGSGRTERSQSARTVTAGEQSEWNRMLQNGNPAQLRDTRRAIRRTLFESDRPGNGTLSVDGVGRVTYNREQDGSYTIRTMLSGTRRAVKKTVQASRETEARGEARNTLESEWIKREGSK